MKPQTIHPAHCACRACQPVGPATPPRFRAGLIFTGPALALAWLLLCMWVQS